MRRQKGFALIELVLAAALALVIAIWGAQALSHRINDAGAQHHARWMLMVRHAVLAYLEREGERLRQAVLASDLLTQGYHDWASPQLHELKTAGLLTTGFPEHMRPLDGVRIRILREGECPGDDCRLGAVLHSQRAYMKAEGVVDEQMLAQWQLASEGLGGIVHPSQPLLIRGSTFQYPNPPDTGPALQAGTVAMAVSDAQLRHLDYLKVRDDRNPEFQSDATVAGNINAGGVVSVGDYLRFGSSGQWLHACPETGALTHDPQAGLLICKDGIWDIVANRGGGYSTNSHYDCFTPEGRSSANPVTGSCSCPLGYSMVPISEGGSEESGRGITRGYLCVY